MITSQVRKKTHRRSSDSSEYSNTIVFTWNILCYRRLVYFHEVDDLLQRGKAGNWSLKLRTAIVS